MFVNPHLSKPDPQAVRKTPIRPPDSNPGKVIDAIEDTLDLSSAYRNIFATYQALTPTERETYLEQLAQLLKAGIVGTETLEVRGSTYQCFVTTRFADPIIAHARPAD